MSDFRQYTKDGHFLKEAVRRFSGDSRYEFYHFAAKDTATLPGINFIVTEVTPSQRYATARLLEKHCIDLVLLLSTWPETFSFVAYEAISADAQIICLADSGNVAELVRRVGCGEVFKSIDDVINYLDFMSLEQYFSVVRNKRFAAENVGTTATIKAARTNPEHACA